MKHTFKSLVIAAMLLICSVGVQAQTPKYEPFFVSGIIKLRNSEATVQSIQGLIVSDSPGNARLVFAGLAARQFPDYVLIDSVASTFSQLYKTLPSSSGSTPAPQLQSKDSI